MQKLSGRDLASIFIESDDFRALTDVQRKNFSARLNYIEEIAENIQTWLKGREAPLKEFLDNLELDVSASLNTPNNEEMVSSWLIHSSWTFGSTAYTLREQLGADTKALVDASPPSSECSPDEICLWLDRQATGLSELLEKFYTANSYPEAIAVLIALDILLAQLSLATSSARFNAQIF